MYMYNIHLDNGMIVGTGMSLLKALEENSDASEVELVLKYENNVITIVPKN